MRIRSKFSLILMSSLAILLFLVLLFVVQQVKGGLIDAQIASMHSTVTFIEKFIQFKFFESSRELSRYSSTLFFDLSRIFRDYDEKQSAAVRQQLTMYDKEQSFYIYVYSHDFQLFYTNNKDEFRPLLRHELYSAVARTGVYNGFIHIEDDIYPILISRIDSQVEQSFYSVVIFNRSLRKELESFLSAEDLPEDISIAFLEYVPTQRLLNRHNVGDTLMYFGEDPSMLDLSNVLQLSSGGPVEVVTYDSKDKYIVIHRYIYNYYMKLVSFLPLQAIESRVFPIRNAILVPIAFTVIILGLFLTLLVNKIVIRRIGYINDNITKVENGDYKIVVLHDRFEDEITHISQNVCSMAQTILNREQELMDKNEEVQRLQRYLSNILDSMPSMLVSIDPDGRIYQWNKTISEKTSIPISKANGSILWKLLPEMARYKKAVDELLIERKSLEFRREAFSSWKDRFFHVTIFPLIDDRRRGAVIKIDDISEIENLNSELRQIQKMETIGTLASGLAHDFNNVLGGIFGSVTILGLELEDMKDKEQAQKLQEYRQAIKRSADRAKELVQQLLTISRKRTLQIETVDLRSCLENIEAVCQTTFDRSVVMNIAYPAHPVLIQAEAGQIEQLFLNLFINANHAMTIMRPSKDFRGGHLTVEIERVSADSALPSVRLDEVYAAYWLVKVADTGVGMSNEIKERIFDPFFSTKTEESGTGLGLSVVYGIVSKHSGYIDVQSQPGKGTEISLYFPVCDEAFSVENRTEQREMLNYVGGDGLILLVDDDAMMRRLLQTMLEKAGYTVLSAEDGEKGLEQFRQNTDSIDLVLLDLVMPNMSGKEAFFHIRKIKPKQLVVLMSGNTLDDRVDELLEKGVTGILQKPFSHQDLMDCIHSALEEP